jgi:hypothetical protein
LKRRRRCRCARDSIAHHSNAGKRAEEAWALQEARHVIDIFDFWAGLPGSAHFHPADKDVLDQNTHHFDLQCLVGPYRGPLRTAPVVLLFLSPGLDSSDKDHAKTAAAQRYYARMRTGNCQLPTLIEHESAWRWTDGVLKQFRLDHDAVRSKIAFLNICAYKSKNFDDFHMLAALPSSRVCLDWAQTALFPQAISNERVVVCLRSPKFWGLGTGLRRGRLFAPPCNRGGRMLLEGHAREETIAAVHQALIESNSN